MKKIEKILQHLEKQGIDIARFERESDISNGYFRNTKQRKADITDKILDKIKEKKPEIYSAVFGDGEVPKDGKEVTPASKTEAEKHKDEIIALLTKHNEQLFALSMSKESIISEVRDVKTNLDDAADKQQTFRVVTNERLREALETLAELRGLNKHELVNRADSIAAVQLDEYAQKSNS